MCLLGKEKLAILMESIMERTRERRKWAKQLQRGLLSQQELFHKASKDTDAAFKAGYVISQLIAKVGKPFNEEEERKKKFVQQRCCRQTTWQSGIIHYQVISMNKGRSFTATPWRLMKVLTMLSNFHQRCWSLVWGDRRNAEFVSHVWPNQS